MAEWLGSGLQNHLQRFESARDLRVTNPETRSVSGFFVFKTNQACLSVVLKTKNRLCAAAQKDLLLTLVKKDRRRQSAFFPFPENRLYGQTKLA